MKVLAVGASGEFAGLVVPELKKQGHQVTALVHHPEKQQGVLQQGTDTVIIGDLDDINSLMTAVQGVDAVFHLIPAFKNEVAAGLNMVKAAKDAGVRKFVFSSVYHPSLSLVNHADKRPTEEALYKSGMDYTILQPAMFMQMLQPSFKAARDSKTISGPYSKHSRMSYVDYREVAEIAALAITDPRLAYGTFELASPGMYSREDIAQILGRVLNAEITAQQIPPLDAIAKINLPGKVAQGMQAMFLEYDQFGFSGGNSLILETILKRKPTTLEQYIISALQ